MISVIIPIYNSEKYLARCLDSIINQTYRDLEIILINDGSTDNSVAICEKYSNLDSRVKLFNQDNKGVSAARNRGLKEIHGEWVSFVDSDDWLELDIFELALCEQRYNDVDLVAWSQLEEYKTKSKFVGFSEKKIIALQKNEIERLRLSAFTGKGINGKREGGIRNLYARIIRADIIIQNHMMFDEKLKHHEDMLFMLQIFENVTSAVLLNQYSYHRGMHDDSAIHKYYPGIIVDNEITSKAYRAFLDEYKKSKEYYEFYYGLHVYWFMQIMNLYILHSENKNSLKENKKIVYKLLEEGIYKEAFSSDLNTVVLSKRIFAWIGRNKLINLLFLYTIIYNWIRK